MTSTRANRASGIKLTDEGAFLIKDKAHVTKIAGPIKLEAIGKRQKDGVMIAKITFQTMHGEVGTEFFERSNLLPEKQSAIKTRLADLGYEWPENPKWCAAILRAVSRTRPAKKFRMVSAPGWYGDLFVLPDEVFAFNQSKKKEGIYIDPDTDAHVAPFTLGEGTLKGWQRHVAKPSRQSCCLRLSIAAAFAAPFLRPLGLDSFGINWFGDTSNGKSLCLLVCGSVAGLIGQGGLPGWADSERGIEDQARGHRDGAMPCDETADGEHRTELPRKARMLAFLVARNRPRTLSHQYEKENGLNDREFRTIVLSTSERALGQIARAAGGSRLGGEEVRLVDISATEPGSQGIFDRYINPAPDKTSRETAKQLVEELKANAIKHQGHALREFLRRYMRHPSDLATLKRYKAEFERMARVPDAHNAYYRVQSNFALMYAAAALAIDYRILPWKKAPTFKAIEKCLHRAIQELQLEPSTPGAFTESNAFREAPAIAQALKQKLDQSALETVVPKQQISPEQARKREAADGFRIGEAIYLKPPSLKAWFPSKQERQLIRRSGIFRTERSDTATVDRKIAGIKGKPRYYVIDVERLEAVRG